MNKYCVHFGVRLTYDIFVEADTKADAIEKAQTEWMNVPYDEMECVDNDVDVWEEAE